MGRRRSLDRQFIFREALWLSKTVISHLENLRDRVVYSRLHETGHADELDRLHHRIQIALDALEALHGEIVDQAEYGKETALRAHATRHEQR